MNMIIMSNFKKLEITSLDITVNNYMIWAIGAKMHLSENELLEVIDKLKIVSYEKKIKL